MDRVTMAIKSLEKAAEHYSRLAARYEKEIGEIQEQKEPDRQRWNLLLQKQSLCRLKMQLITLQARRYELDDPDNDSGYQAYKRRVDFAKEQYLQRYCYNSRKTPKENRIAGEELEKGIYADISEKVESAKIKVMKEYTKTKTENEIAKKISTDER